MTSEGFAIPNTGKGVRAALAQVGLLGQALVLIALSLASAGTWGDSAHGGEAPSAAGLERRGEQSAKSADPRISRALLRERAARSSATVRTFSESSRATWGEPLTVELVMSAIDPATASALEAMSGVEVRYVSPRYRRIELRIADLQVLERIAAVAGVRQIRRAYSPGRRGHGSGGATNTPRHSGIAANAAALLDLPQPFVDGAGQVVGILSDSFARTDNDSPTEVADGVRISGTTPQPCESGPLRGAQNQVSGDLPARVELLDDSAEADADLCLEGGSAGLQDEGAAMAELIHHIAPAAGIAFHTAFGGPSRFADGIDELCDPARTPQTTVLVDDIGYPFRDLIYQPDIVAQAAQACVERGTPYVAAAGNSGDLGFREEFEPSTTTSRHAWADNSDYVAIELEPGRSFSAVLQWNQPALSSPDNERNGPQIDLDLLLVSFASDGTTNVEAVSDEDQQANDPSAGFDPVERIVNFRNDSRRTRSYALAVEHVAGNRDKIPQDPAGQSDLEFSLVFPGVEPGSGDGVAIQYLDFDRDAPGAPPSAGPTLYGQPAAPGVIAVGAVGWYEAFDATLVGSAEIDARRFTARGGRRSMVFDAAGDFVAQTTRTKPELSAPDGDNTTFLGGVDDVPDAVDAVSLQGERDRWPNFTGTSASAAVVAGVIALLQDYAAGLKPSAALAALQNTATDVTGDRAGPGVDPVTGAGLIDAAAALDRFPVADAGADRETRPGETIVLDGSASRASRTDSDASLARYQWQILDGAGSLTAGDTARPTLEVSGAGGSIELVLIVENDRGLTHADRVTVAVNQPPDGDADPDGGGESDSDSDADGDRDASGGDSSDQDGEGDAAQGGGGGALSVWGLLVLAAILVFRVAKRRPLSRQERPSLTVL